MKNLKKNVIENNFVFFFDSKAVGRLGKKSLNVSLWTSGTERPNDALDKYQKVQTTFHISLRKEKCSLNSFLQIKKYKKNFFMKNFFFQMKK